MIGLILIAAALLFLLWFGFAYKVRKWKRTRDRGIAKCGIRPTWRSSRWRHRGRQTDGPRGGDADPWAGQPTSRRRPASRHRPRDGQRKPRIPRRNIRGSQSGDGHRRLLTEKAAEPPLRSLGRSAGRWCQGPRHHGRTEQPRRSSRIANALGGRVPRIRRARRRRGRVPVPRHPGGSLAGAPTRRATGEQPRDAGRSGSLDALQRRPRLAATERSEAGEGAVRKGARARSLRLVVDVQPRSRRAQGKGLRQGR